MFIPEGVEIIEEAAFFNSRFSYVSLPSTLKVLEEAFSYDGVHVEMMFTISDELDDVDDEPGCLAKCRKASASSGAEYYMKLDCMKKHEGLFWLTPEILFAIEKFPKYMKIMPQKLNNSQLEGIGVSFR